MTKRLIKAKASLMGLSKTICAGETIELTELELEEPVAEHALQLCAERAKIVAEEQEKAKAEAEAKRAEEEAAASAILAGAVDPSENPEAAAAAILGGAVSENTESNEGTQGDSDADDRAADILGN